MYHPGHYTTFGAFTRDEHTTNLRFRVFSAGPVKRPKRKHRLAFLHA
jgi:hypothetical protein